MSKLRKFMGTVNYGLFWAEANGNQCFLEIPVFLDKFKNYHELPGFCISTLKKWLFGAVGIYTNHAYLIWHDKTVFFPTATQLVVVGGLQATSLSVMAGLPTGVAITSETGLVFVQVFLSDDLPNSQTMCFVFMFWYVFIVLDASNSSRSSNMMSDKNPMVGTLTWWPWLAVWAIKPSFFLTSSESEWRSFFVCRKENKTCMAKCET